MNGCTGLYSVFVVNILVGLYSLAKTAIFSFGSGFGWSFSEVGI